MPLKVTMAVLCALALVVSGCGSKSYKQKASDAAKQFEKTSQDAGKKLQAATTKAQFSDGVNEFQGAVSTFTNKLRSLKPPGKAKGSQRQLINVLNSFSTDVGSVRDALNAGDIATLQRQAARVRADVATVRAAASDLESKAGG